jgi:hypothetical protein
MDVLPNTPFFDRNALSRMSLPYDPDQQESGSEVEEEEEAKEEEEEEVNVAHSPQQAPPNVEYEDLITRVQQLSTNQERFSTTQDRLVASHYVMQYQLSSIRDNQTEMMRQQMEMMRRFNDQFPPPPQ